MLNVYLINELLLSAIGAAIFLLFRAAGGLHGLPRSNEDLVWY